MCGRYTLAAGADDLAEAFDVPTLTFDLAPRYNIAPGQSAPVVAADGRGKRAGLLTWGLVPAWADEPGEPMINARVESVALRPSFREAVERRRCLVPADGFYEWKGESGRRVPHWIHPAGGGVISFAGIWERWSRPGAEARNTCAILTAEANADVAPIHHRMPVIVAAAQRSEWLERSVGAAAALDLLKAVPLGVLTSHAVSPRVNRAVEDDAGLIERV